MFLGRVLGTLKSLAQIKTFRVYLIDLDLCQELWYAKTSAL